MTYIENVLVCIAAPLLITALFMGMRALRTFLFFFAGMAACLLSAYVNTFFAAVTAAGAMTATVEIAPVGEEILKLLPMLFYLLVFVPNPSRIKDAVLLVSAGFATFENICYLMQNGAEELGFLLIRGFGTGAMHITCGAILGYGLAYVWKHGWLKAAGTLGLLGTAVTFHAVYNLLIAAGGAVQYIAYGMPLVTMAAGLAAGRLLVRRGPASENQSGAA